MDATHALGNPLRAFEKCRRRLYDCLDGYHITDEEITQGVETFFNLLIRCPLLPLAAIRQCYSVFEKQMPQMLKEAFLKGLADLESSLPIEVQNDTGDSENEEPKSTKSGIPETTPAHGCVGYHKAFDQKLQEVVQELYFTLSSCPEKSPVVEQTLVRYYHGQLAACLVEVDALLESYLEVEEIFHNSELDVAGLILHGKRPEMEPRQLLYCARSHQGLRSKNQMIIGLMKCLRFYYHLLNDCATGPPIDANQTGVWQNGNRSWDYIDSGIRRLSQLSKLPYTQVTDHARQLLLLRRDGPPFQERTRELIEALWDLMDHQDNPGHSQTGAHTCVHSAGAPYSASYSQHPPPSAPMSPTAFGNIYSHRMSPSPPGLSLPMPATTAAANNSGTIGLCALDLSRFPTESLVVALCHKNSEIQKLALQILVMRIYGVKPGKVNEFVVKARGEAWYPATNLPSTEDTMVDLQTENALIAVWSHESLFNYDWLTANCDILKEDDPSSAVADVPVDGSMTSRVENTSQRLSSRYVAAGSRLHHMLNAFGTAGDAGESHGINGGRLQQTTAFLIHSPVSFVHDFRRCLTELRDLQNHMMDPPPSMDGRVLLCVIVDVLKTNTIDFKDCVNKCSDLLSALQTNLVWFSYLCQEHAFEVLEKPIDNVIGENSGTILKSAAPDMAHSHKLSQSFKPRLASLSCISPKTTKSISMHGRRIINESTKPTTDSYFDAALPTETPSLKFFYFRNVKELPYHRNTNLTVENEWEEETLLRNCEVPLFHYLELKRLSRFNCSKSFSHGNSIVHVFCGQPKNTAEKSVRHFVRMIINVTKPLTSEMGIFEQERCFVTGLNFLQMCLRESSKPSTNNHLLLTVQYISDSLLKKRLGSGTAAGVNIAGGSLSGSGATAYVTGAFPSYVQRLHSAPDQPRLTPTMAEQIARDIYQRYEKRLIKLHATTIEFRFKTRGVSHMNRDHGAPALTDGVYPYRIVLENPSGQSLRCRRYVEIQNPSTGERVFAALDSGDALSTLILKSNPSAQPAAACASGACGVCAGCSDFTRGPMMGHASSGSALHNTATLYAHQAACSSGGGLEDYDGRPIDTPHPWAGRLESKRSAAAALSTMYIYDFIDLLEVAVRNAWRKCPRYLLGNGETDDATAGSSHKVTSSVAAHPNVTPSVSQGPANVADLDGGGPTILVPDKVVEVTELVLDKRGDIQEVNRPSGQNDCGMVAWKVLLRTPEFPKGRRIIVIGNDVTFFMGTFGVREDYLFQRASQMARQFGIPRIYIAVNSGARMGLAPELQNTFKVEWMDPQNPKLGFKFIYLTDHDYNNLPPDCVNVEPINHPIEGKIWKILDVYGQQTGLGVENLCGSAAIAGETARAYKEAVTITYVTGRTVGIGAYLARLGHRVIQKETGAPILLTGFQALNRLIGRHVYTSNNEIGGPDVMYNNGVTHQVVRTDLEGCEAILDWLGFVPEHREGPLPVMIDPNDPITRRIEYKPSSLTDDPRYMLTGCADSNGGWLGGLLDKGSFAETMKGYASSVICGRGRLGGLPLGCILVETRVTEMLIPPDPALPMSCEQRLIRAGQVWFPESAYKTAQAINDFNKEEIPLLIMANWRGFSGGQRDMFHEVLKFGSMIVDALVDYHQPCLVYIPPKGELRGGAWVVVDPRINPDHMDMFAAPDSRGGVMQPTGTVEIKFRDKALQEAAIRSDHELQRITEQIAGLQKSGVVSSSDSRLVQLEELKAKRLENLMPVMRQVAVHFADLHDTASRMKKKKAITDIVPWHNCRQVFYWRFRRQLILYNLRNEAIKHNPKLTVQHAQKLICDWALEQSSGANDQQFVQWACTSIQDLSKRLHTLRQTYIRDRVIDLCKESLNAVVQGLKQLDKNNYDRLLAILEKNKKTDSERQADAQKTALDTMTSSN